MFNVNNIVLTDIEPIKEIVLGILLNYCSVSESAKRNESPWH